jgi:Holliday junction resolvasome RuvABC DNA-binding subunit
MIYRLKGQVIAILKDRVAIDVHDVAYEVLVSRVQEFTSSLRDRSFHLRSDHPR